MTEDFRKTAPDALSLVPFNIPKPFEAKLENGLKIVIFEDRRLPLVSYRLSFPVGDIDSPDDLRGLASAVSSMLSEGTGTRTSREFADEVERLGANISANSTTDNTVIAGSSLSLYASDVLELISEMILVPTFPENELKIYRQNTIEGLKFQRSQPGFLAEEQTARILYGDHPYSVSSPTPRDIENLTSERLAEFHREFLVARNATLVVVGDVSIKTILTEIEDRFGSWEQGLPVKRDFPSPPTRSATTMTLVDRPGSAQSNIVISNIALARNDPDYFPAIVMNQVLGAGASARLFMNLREEKGYTYGAYSSFDTRRLAGAFEATSEVRTAVTGDSIKEFLFELNRIREERVPEQELQDAKNFLTGVFPLRAETQEGLTNLINSQQLYNLPDDYLQTYREHVAAVSVDEVAAVAAKFIKPEQFSFVIVGDVENILPQVEHFAESIEIFDTEGAPLDLSRYGSAVEPENIHGIWDLSVEAQGQKIKIELELAQNGSEISGTLSSMFGNGEIAGARMSGNRFTGSAATEMQGETMAFTIIGTVEGDYLKGTIETGIPGFPPLPFDGTRNAEIK